MLCENYFDSHLLNVSVSAHEPRRLTHVFEFGGTRTRRAARLTVLLLPPISRVRELNTIVRIFFINDLSVGRWRQNIHESRVWTQDCLRA